MTNEEIDLHREAMRVEDRLVPSCKRCRYWDPNNSEETSGVCTRQPPVGVMTTGRDVNQNPVGSYVGLFPRTTPEQRCGEFLTSWPGETRPGETPALDRIADASWALVELTDSLCGAIRGLREDIAR